MMRARGFTGTQGAVRRMCTAKPAAPTPPTPPSSAPTPPQPSRWKRRLVLTGAVVGITAGALGNMMEKNPTIRDDLVFRGGDSIKPVLSACDSVYGTYNKVASLATGKESNKNQSTRTSSDESKAAKRHQEKVELEKRREASPAPPAVAEPAVAPPSTPAPPPVPVPVPAPTPSKEDVDKRIAALREEHVQNVIRLTENHRELHRAEMEHALQEQQRALKAQTDKLLETAVNKKTEEFNQERLEKVADLTLVEGKVDVFKAALDRASDYQRESHKLHRMALASGTLSSLIDLGVPLATPLRFLGTVAAENPVVQVALNSLDERTYDAGVHPQHRLTERFPRVVARARQAALVPEDSGLWGEVYAFVMDLLSIRLPASAHTPGSTQAGLAQAEAMMEAGNLAGAVLALESLQGRPGEAVRDWTREARRRAVLLQAVDLLNAEANTTAESLS